MGWPRDPPSQEGHFRLGAVSVYIRPETLRSAVATLDRGEDPTPINSTPFGKLLRRLSAAGFKKDFVRQAILPEWWDDDCANDPRVIRDIEIRVARFLGISIESVSNPRIPLAPRQYPLARLRRVRDLDRDRLGPAIHAAIQVASAVARNLAPHIPDPIANGNLPGTGGSWRSQLPHPSQSPGFAEIVADLWSRGVPVVPAPELPAPAPQAIACIVEGRPVIVLGHRHDAPGRVAFIVAHEAGHVANGDCAPEQPVVDEEDEAADDSEMERKADQYALGVLTGDRPIPQLDLSPSTGFRDLATGAIETERSTGVDATTVIYSWARESGDYVRASQAVQALYRHQGARLEMQNQFWQNIAVSSLPETDRELLRCIDGGLDVHQAAH